jgi:hypothetical protein
LNRLLKDKFTIMASKTYSKFFSECIDTVITLAFSLLKKDEQASQKGVLVTGHDLVKFQRLFRLYSAIYPVVWFFAKLDVLVWSSGYMLIAKAKSNRNECSAERLCLN